MLVVRSAQARDLDAVEALARASGPGFTSLAMGRAALAERLVDCEAAFAAPEKPEPGEERYLLVLEDLATGRICGMSGIKAAIGYSKPFFNFRVLTVSQASRAGNRRFDLDVLVLVNEYTGCSEVGSLFVDAGWRGSGTGRLLAQSRYLLMAAAPARFGRLVVSELRGVVSADGQSPFWEHLGRAFFRMDFAEADQLSSETDNQFVLDLMPKHPIYVDLLHEEARAVMGQCHAEGRGALALLNWEGFRYDHVVDIFDGGPLVLCAREDIRTIKESFVATARAGLPGTAGRMALASSDRFSEFRVCQTQVRLEQGSALLPPEVLAALGLAEGDPVRLWLRHE